MKYASQITGLPVISFETGKKFEKVKDIIFDDENNQVLAFLTDTAGLFSSAKVIRFQDIKSIGDDAIIVPTTDVEVTADTDEMIAEAVKKDNSVKGKTIMTEDGRDLGTISDLEIDEHTGKVTGYQTSGGIFSDMYKGKSVVPAPMTIKVGENVVFVPNSTADFMEAQVGGLKAAGQNVAQKAGDLKDQAVSKTQELTQSAKYTAGNVKDQASSKLDEVKASATSDETHHKIDDVKGKATDLFEKIKEKASDLKDQATQKMENSKISSALGRPASRVILDHSDSVILNTGDLITNESVEKARAAGVLDILLSSVIIKEPELSTEDLKAKNA